jgi:hypothetical protein
MATSNTVTPKGILKELTQVVEQVKAGKELGREEALQGRALSTMSTKLVELKPFLEEKGASGDIDSIATLLSEWSEILAPKAEQLWDKETVTAQITVLEAFKTLGTLSEDEVAEFEALKPNLAGIGKSGTRAERKPQERIADRPERVSVSMADTIFSTQAGNVPNSASNLKNAAAKQIEKVTGEAVEVNGDISKGLLAAAKAVVEDGKESTEFGGVTFSVAS